jgi:sodium transport system permease protein
MKLSNIFFLFKKELTGIVRDQRAILLLVLFPLLCYPMLIAGLSYFQNDVSQRLMSYVPRIVIVDNTDGLIKNAIEEDKRFEAVVSSNYEQELNDGIIQGVLLINTYKNKQYEVQYLFDSTISESRRGYELISEFMTHYSSSLIDTALSMQGIDKEILDPIYFTGKDRASEEKRAGLSYSILPYFMVISILTGAITTGMDLTVGEKERGTLATLLSSQMSNREIIVGKLLVVSFTGVVSSILSVVGLCIAITMNDTTSSQFLSLSLYRILMILLILLPTSIFLSSLIVNIGMYSRSMKEGSSYTTPLYMMIIFLGVLTTIEGFNLNDSFYFVPILNALFLLRSIIFSQIDIKLYLITLLATLLYTVLSIHLSLKLCEREEVLFRT